MDISQSRNFFLYVFSLALVAAPLVLTGCDKKNTNGQTVATVNGEEITRSDLNLELSNIPPAQRADATQQVVQSLVNRKLLAEDAKKRDFEKGSDFTIRLRRMRELLLAQLAAQAAAQADSPPPSDSEISAYVNSHPSIGSQHRVLSVDRLQFATPPTSAKLKTLESARTLSELMAMLSAQRMVVSRTFGQVDTASLNNDVLARLDALKPGEPLIMVNGPSAVADSIIDIKLVPLAPEESRRVAKARITSQKYSAALTKYEEVLRGAAEISYSKDYMPRRAAKDVR